MEPRQINSEEVLALSGWHHLSRYLRTLDSNPLGEDLAWELLDFETNGKARADFILRIYGWAARRRYTRERAAFLKLAR